MDHKSALDRKVLQLLDAGLVAEYLTMIEELTVEYPADADVRLHYGRSLALTGGRPAEAIAQIQIATTLAPEDPVILTLAASLMFDAGELAIAQGYVRRAHARVTLSRFAYGAELVNLAGRLAAAQGDRERARPLLHGASEAEPANCRYAKDFARFLLDEGGWAKAREVVTAALLEHPNDGELRRIAERET